MNRDDKRSITVQIDGVTEAQALAIEDMLATWVSLGSMGASRWTAFYADGDGNFHPRITVDGHKAHQTPHITKPRYRRFTTAEEIYAVDFDHIAWSLRARDEASSTPR